MKTSEPKYLKITNEAPESKSEATVKFSSKKAMDDFVRAITAVNKGQEDEYAPFITCEEVAPPPPPVLEGQLSLFDEE